MDTFARACPTKVKEAHGRRLPFGAGWHIGILQQALQRLEKEVCSEAFSLVAQERASQIALILSGNDLAGSGALSLAA